MRGEIFRKKRGGTGMYDRFMPSPYLIVCGADIIISDAAHEQLGKPDYVSIIVNRKDRKFGLRSMGKNDPVGTCYKIQNNRSGRNDGGHEVVRLHASSLIAEMSLPTSKDSATAYHAALDDDGDLIVDLRQGGETFQR